MAISTGLHSANDQRPIHHRPRHEYPLLARFRFHSQPNDFNHDGTSDILWRNDGGILTDWLMNDGQYTGSGYGYSVETMARRRHRRL